MALLLLLWLITSGIGSLPAWGQSTFDLYGSARASGLADATTGLHGDAGVQANPGLRGFSPSRTLVFYARETYGLSELRYGAVHLGMPVRTAHLSVGAGTFGFEDYREVHLNGGLAAAVPVGTTRRLGLGVNARYHHLRIPGYGRAGALTLNIGIAAQVLPALTLGSHATNVLAAHLSGGGDLPQTLAVGLGYAAAESIVVVVDAFKDIDFPLALRGGIELRPVRAFAIRAGATSEPVRFTVGSGISVGPVAADLAAEQHADLGWSPSAALTVSW